MYIETLRCVNHTARWVETERRLGQLSEAHKTYDLAISRGRRYRILRFLIAASARYEWRLLKRPVKVLIGRKSRFDEEGLFLRQYVLHLTGMRPIRRITCTGLAGEGAGSQALTIMNAINFARAFGLVYVHTPFSSIKHADRPMYDWVKACRLGSRNTDLREQRSETHHAATCNRDANVE